MKALGLITVIALIILAVIFFPFAIIWSLNILFNLSIPTTFETWCAVVVLGGALRANVTVSK
jgi:hypothetical protein